MNENQNTGNNAGGRTSFWQVIGGLFLALYGGQIIELGAATANFYTAVVQGSGEELIGWLRGFWTNREKIQRRAAKDLAGWLASLIVGAILGSIGLGMEPGFWRSALSGSGRIIAVVGLVYIALRAAGPLALVNVAIYWATATVDLVHGPLDWIFRGVQSILARAGAIQITASGPRIVDTKRVREVGESIQLHFVMVVLVLSALVIAVPSITLLVAVVTAFILAAAYVSVAGIAGWAVDWGYKVIANGLIVLMAGTGVSALLKFAMPESFNWLLCLPDALDRRVVAVFSHGIVQSAIDLVDGVWAVESGGRLPSGAIAEASNSFIQLGLADRIGIGLIYALLAIGAITLFMLKLAILRAKFRQKSGVSAVPATGEAAVLAEASEGAVVRRATSRPVSWAWILVSALLAVAVIGGVVYGVHRIAVSWSAEAKNPAAQSPAASAPASSGSAVAPAPASKTDDSSPPRDKREPKRLAAGGHRPVKPAPATRTATVGGSASCAEFPEGSNARERCVALEAARRENPFSDER